MAMKRCESGHFYDTEKHTSCPACGVAGLEIEATLARGASTERYDLDAPTLPRESRQSSPEGQRGSPGMGFRGSDPAATVAQVKKKLGIDPVVGWLVCVSGQDKGRDFRIKNERNFIGRAPGMDICISGDDGISRERHAVISFNPRKSTYLLMPGESHGLVYHNDDEVIGPIELKPYDVIEMGQTKLLFLPFCGPQFSWNTVENQQP
jgi:Inner membrane component of T3SS, cytoplasmic domain